LTETAEADLAEIWAFIAEDSKAAANRLLDKIEATLSWVQDFPMSGAPRGQRNEPGPHLRKEPRLTTILCATETYPIIGFNAPGTENRECRAAS
jgi:plasmid stabilization system protein ParE